MVFLRLALAAAALLAAAPSPPPQDEAVVLDEMKKDFLDRLRKLEENRDWKGLFDQYFLALRRYGQKVVPADAESWTGLGEFLIQRFSRLPREALDYYRLEYDGRARAAFERARESGDRRALEKAVDDFFFSSETDNVLDALGRSALEEGRPDEAVLHWNRLLRGYPDSEIPRPVTAARIANACLVSRNEAALDDLRAHAASAGLDGPVRVGHREGLTLRAWLESLRIAAPPRAERIVRAPDIRDPAEAPRRRSSAVRNEIRRWSYDFTDKPAAPQVSAPILRGTHDFPFFPAYAKIGGREYVIFTDGFRVVAIDPTKVRSKTPSAGIYWKDVPAPRAMPARDSGQVLARPNIGVTVDGEYAFVTLYSAKPRNAEVQVNQYDLFEGTTTLRCYHIPYGRMIWEVDQDRLSAEFKQQKLFDRNFSFSAPPVAKDGRLYLGICSSPSGEQESAVLCLDHATGRPLWASFLASLNGGNAMFMRGMGGIATLHPTMIAEQGGVIYAQTNLGVVAALNGVTGGVLWLRKYKRSAMRHPQEAPAYPMRPAGAPLLWKDRLLLLTQDRDDLMALDRTTGRPINLPPARKSGGVEIAWKNMICLVGLLDDFIVVGGGEESYRVDLKTFQANALTASNTSGNGRGLVTPDHVYLGVVMSEPGRNAGLALYDASRWKLDTQEAWKDPVEKGNLLLAGDCLVVSGPRVTVYTGIETLRAEFAGRIQKSPPQPEALLEYADAMLDNERFGDAADAYLAFMRAVEGDSAYEARARKVRADLHAIFMRRGRDEKDASVAVEHFRRAREFAPDLTAEADSVEQLAQLQKKLQRWREATDLWQWLVENAGGQVRRVGDGVTKLSDLAQQRIDEIVKVFPDAYQGVERRAAEAFREAREKGAEALRQFRARFPNSKAARDAWQKLLESLLKDGKLFQLMPLFLEQELDFETSLMRLEVLEKIGDRERLRDALATFGGRFAETVFGPVGAQETAKDHAARRLRDRASAPAEAPPAGPLRKVAEIGDAAAPACFPLRPLGIEPASFGRHLELFARGSGVELWDLGENRRVWSRPHPGAVKPGSPAALPAIVGASWTSDYALAVAWDDMAASLDPATGAVLWTFRGVRERFYFRACHATEGRFYLYESFRIESARAALEPEEGHERLLCIDDSTGRLAWGRVYDFEAANPILQSRLTFLGRYLDDRMTLLQAPSRPGSNGFLRRHAAADGAEAHKPQELPGQMMAYTVDAAGGVLYYVEMSGDSNTGRVLRSVALDPARKDYKPLQVNLSGKYLQGAQFACALAADREFVCMAAPAPNANADDSIWIFKAADGSEVRRIKLPEGRMLPLSSGRNVAYAADEEMVQLRFRTVRYGGRQAIAPPRAGGLPLDDEGLLYVYNVPKDKSGALPSRAHLTAFRIGSDDVLAWDGPAPVMTNRTDASWTLAPGPGRYAVFSAPHAAIPGRAGDDGAAFVYDRAAEGYLHSVHAGLLPSSDGSIAAVWRGRLHLATRQGLQIYGH